MGYVARQDNKAINGFMDKLNEELDSSQLDSQTIYIATRAYSGRFNQSFQEGKVEAINLDEYIVFFKKGWFSKSLTDSLKYESLPLPKSLSEKKFFVELSLKPTDQVGSILFGIDYVRTIDKQLIVAGWATLESKTRLSADSIKLILKSADNKLYGVNSNVSIRKDISARFNNAAMDSTGFYGSFLADSLPKGNYELAILIEDKITKARTYKFVQRVNLGYSERFDPRPFTEQFDSVETHFGIDKLDEVQNVLKIAGWALLPDTVAAGRQISILLRSEDGSIYISPTHTILRVDVTDYFGGKINRDESGFDAIISKRTLPPAKYEIGIYIKDPKENKGSAQFLGYFIEK